MSIVSEIVNDGGYQIEDQFIQISEFTRPQTRINPIGGIIHWTGNIGIGSGAQATRNFFNNRGDGKYGSAHTSGDTNRIIGCLPYMPNDVEIGYHVGGKQYYTDHFGSYPNNSTIGHEMCVNRDGNFRESYKRAVWVLAYWSSIYNWNPQTDIMRHYDITHKDCPLPMLDLIHDDNHCTSYGWSMDDTNWMRANLHIDGVQGEALWVKFKDDVTELTEILLNGGIQMIKELEARIKELENFNAMPTIPDWSQEWVSLFVQKGWINTPENRPNSFYTMVTVLGRILRTLKLI